MAAEHDFSTWPRREEAAKRLGISVPTLRRYEGKLINPIKDKNGHNRFDPEELDALAPKLRKSGKRKASAPKPRKGAPRPAPSRDAAPAEQRVSGAVTKRAFEMFEQNCSRVRVAIELGETVENVNWLWESYLVFSGKMDADAARQSVGGASKPSSSVRQAQPSVQSINYETYLRSRPRGSLDAGELRDLQYIENLDARHALFEETRREVLAEWASAGRSVPDGGSFDSALLARPRDSFSPAERTLVEILEALQEEDRRRRTA